MRRPLLHGLACPTPSPQGARRGICFFQAPGLRGASASLKRDRPPHAKMAPGRPTATFRSMPSKWLTTHFRRGGFAHIPPNFQHLNAFLRVLNHFKAPAFWCGPKAPTRIARIPKKSGRFNESARRWPLGPFPSGHPGGRGSIFMNLHLLVLRVF